MELQGKIKTIGETQTYGTFQKREFILTTADQYPQDIQLELHQDKVDLINSYKVGDDVKVSINLRGKEWINPEGVAKYFNTIVGWRIEAVNETPQQEQAAAQPVMNVHQDDLPF